MNTQIVGGAKSELREVTIIRKEMRGSRSLTLKEIAMQIQIMPLFSFFVKRIV